MNRRDLLQTMIAVPLASLLGGCRHVRKDHRPLPPSRGGTLRVILQGPFALVLDTKNRNRIMAFVPFTSDDTAPEGTHEFRFRNPKDAPVGGEGKPEKRSHFRFTLPDDHLEISDRRPHLDAGFSPVTLHTGLWEPRPDDYFVEIELPPPALITFMPPAIPVLFTGNRLATAPTNFVLEYQVREADETHKVRLHSPQLGDSEPVSCSELVRHYEEHWGEKKQRATQQRSEMKAQVGSCAGEADRVFFLGVGLSPFLPGFEGIAPVHAREFFNQRLLNSFPNSSDRDRLELLQVEPQACSPTGDVTNAPRLMPAVRRYPILRPRLVPVSSADDCRASVLVGVKQ